MERHYSVNDLTKAQFEATKQRGKYLAFIVKELDKDGFKDFDDTLKRAIFNFGKDKSTGWGPLGAKEFMNHLVPDEATKGMMQFNEIGDSSGNRAECTFGRCPLEEGWKEMGLSDQERRRLCSIAQQHDFGIVDNNEELTLEMPEAIGLGYSVCRLIFKKK
jgi:hypothetical protein